MAVNLADMLRGVSNLGTDREQIEYIDIDRIDDDPNNFYELSGIEELAANIELIGLQQPIRVRSHPDDPKRVIIVSGHRRRAAVRVLVEEGKASFRDIPCIRERGEVSAAMQELRLIYANSDTRKLSYTDLSKQAARVEDLLYKLKEEGVEFPGRMRDHVAQACQVSKSKLARLKMIRENLIPELMQRADDKTLPESSAYAISQQPRDIQQIIAEHPHRSGGWPEWYVRRAVESIAVADRFHRDGCEVCSHRDTVLTKMLSVAQSWNGEPCDNATCCASCSELITCSKSCGKCDDLKETRKREFKARQEANAEAQRKREAPVTDGIAAMWKRFGQLRKAAGVTVEECFKACDLRYGSGVDELVMRRESGDYDFSTATPTPMGYAIRYSDVQTLVALAEVLKCSTDALLGRTDVPKLDTVSMPESWVLLEWIDGRERPHRFGQKAVGRFAVEGLPKPILQIVRWDGVCWNYPKGPAMDGTCVGWFPIPEEV